MSVPTAVLNALPDRNRTARSAAAEQVAALSQAAKSALPALALWLDDHEAYFRVTAAATILRIDPLQANRRVPFLLDGLQCENCSVRPAADIV